MRSSVFSTVRGSIGGTVYSQNRYGAYARNRTNPVNPNTTRQVAVRAALTQASQAWRSSADQTLWNNYAAASPVTNRLGESITLSGQAMFNKYVAWALNRGLTPPTVPPVTPGFALTLTVASVTIANSDSTIPNVLTVIHENGETVAGAIYPVWISRPQSAGTTFFKGPWVYLGNLLGTTRDTAMSIPFPVTDVQSFFVRLGYRSNDGKIGLTDFVDGPFNSEEVP